MPALEGIVTASIYGRDHYDAESLNPRENAEETIEVLPPVIEYESHALKSMTR
jgi:hypothetical protein